MAIGGSPPGATRAKDGSKGAAGRFTFLVEAARGYLGPLWLARDSTDASEAGTAYVRHVTPLVAASARAAIVEGARWAIGGAESDRFQLFEGRSAVDLVSPFIDGEILRSLLRTAAVKHTAAEPLVLVGIARDLAEQLESVHERAVATKSHYGFGGVHPDSVVVDVHGGVHLIDVGAGAAASSRESWKSDPQRIGYFAPEQLEVRAVVDARTDVFAIGIFLWEALANRRLFPGNDAKSARERLQKASIPRLDATRASASPAIATKVADVVARCLERSPSARFQSMSELVEALRALDPASRDRVGAWVTAVADAAIGKRRQILERAAAGALTGEERLTLPPPSNHSAAASESLRTSRPPPGNHSATASESLRTSRPPPKPVSSVPAPAPRPSSVPAPVPSALDSGPSKTVVTARSGGTLTSPTPPPPSPSSRPVTLAGAPPPPSSRPVTLAGAPPPPSSRSATLAGAPPPPSSRRGNNAASTPLSPAAATATPSPARPATATPLPLDAAAATPSPARPATATPLPPHAATATPAPARAADATSTPLAGTPLLPAAQATAATGTPPPEATEAPPNGAGPTGEEAAAGPDAPFDGDADVEPDEDDGDDEGLDDVVEDDEPSPEELAAMSKRPPPLPHEEHHLPLAAVAGTVGARLDEPLARPSHANQLAALTAPPAVALPRSAVVAALVSLLALGAFIVYRHRSHGGSTEPRIERTVQTLPVRIEEPLSAVPVAPPEPPPPAPPPAALSAPETSPAPAPSTQTGERTPPDSQKADGAEKPTGKSRAGAAETPHRPPPHEVTHTGFKPGGI